MLSKLLVYVYDFCLETNSFLDPPKIRLGWNNQTRKEIDREEAKGGRVYYVISGYEFDV